MIKTFGPEEGKTQDCDVVQLCLRGIHSNHSNHSVYITAYVVPKVCAPLQNHVTELAYQSFPHLNGLELAGLDNPAKTP